MKSSEIRDNFLKFFESKGHTRVRSSSLVPNNDKTLLFTNSGMVQFKDVFLGVDPRPYSRATTVQRCVRAGGKHNDLENVGYTARHHTFFEMLGNFSFGDYFKRDAIAYAWELLTGVYKLPKEKLWVTVYQEDDEAYAIWQNEIGVPVERIIRIGDNKGARYASDNFWQMGDTGPCGPCSEIFYDHGPEIWGGPPGSEQEDGDRYIEIWNLVFMQFNRDEQGNMSPLPKPCVDTGMGMERLSAVLQHVHSNYEIDLFQALIKAAARETGCTDLENNSLRVIADHIRATSFMIVDGVIPSAEGQGYVLRRIIRRALRHGHKLGQTQAFFYKLVADLDAEMGAAYPELREAASRVAEVLRQEEERFGETLESGMKILDVALAQDASKLDGKTAFTLYATYGFPADLTADICRERQVTFDQEGFDAAMKEHQDIGRQGGKFKDRATKLEYSGEKNIFVGYEHLAQEAKIVALYVNGTAVTTISAGDDAIVVLNSTPFYAESGGQCGDSGVINGVSSSAASSFAVNDTLKVQPDVFGHHGTLQSGNLSVGDTVQAQVDGALRARIVRNHSATHLMHKALREVLGSHVAQKGSQVDSEKTRFDFSHNGPMTQEEIARVEQIVNAEILQNVATQAQVMAFDDAVKHGAMALFGEKYGDSVRVLDIGSSRELCGGTHVTRTGDIGMFKIIAEGGVASGIRRVEAVCGEAAVELVQGMSRRLHEAAASLRAQPEELTQKIAQMQDHVKALEKEIGSLKSKLASGQGDELLAKAVEIGGVKVLAAVLEGAEVAALRDTADKLKDKLKTAAIVLASVIDGKINLIAAVTADSTGKVKAGDLIGFVAKQIGGKGGGRADMAQGGGTDVAALPAALASVAGFVQEKL